MEFVRNNKRFGRIEGRVDVMTKELLEEYLEKVSENTDFTFGITEFNDSKVELEMHGDNPEGEDWRENLDIENPETEKELIGLLYAERT